MPLSQFTCLTARGQMRTICIAVSGLSGYPLVASIVLALALHHRADFKLPRVSEFLRKLISLINDGNPKPAGTRQRACSPNESPARRENVTADVARPSDGVGSSAMTRRPRRAGCWRSVDFVRAASQREGTT